MGDHLNLTILHTNDLHGKLTPESAAKIRELKTEETLYADCGDCTKSGNLAIPLKDDPAWALLDAAGCAIHNHQARLVTDRTGLLCDQGFRQVVVEV